MNRQRPSLKNGVDLQLQSAFNDGNWAVVARLADKRAKTFNDQYYEMVKICAESQLDDPASKFAAVATIEKFAKDGTVIKDVDAIDLLEWASEGLREEEDFPETIGPLRSRLVKASPKDKISGTRCLQSCLLHWDLNSAQQIAAILDRSFPQERSFMFWNIVITHILATSPQSAQEKKKLYGMLALKQIQRAAQLAEQGDDAKQSRSIQSEEEIILLYDIVEKHGSKEDYEKLITSPIFGPLSQFRKDRKELFLRVVAKHQSDGNFEAAFELCKDCLSTEDENGNPNFLASDWKVWRQFIDAAAELKTVKPDVEKTVQNLLLKFIKSPNIKPIYKRVILLARVSAAFGLTTTEGDDLVNGQPSSLRLKELTNYINDQATSAACFDDVKSFLEKLDPSAIQYLAYDYVPKTAEDTEDKLKAARVRTLALKLQYYAATCPSLYITIPGDERKRRCVVSGDELGPDTPSSCFGAIAKSGLELYKSLTDEATEHASVEAEIKPYLAIVIALCHIQTAFPPSTKSTNTPTSIAPLLRALLLLEHQLSLTPKHGVISLLLVQLHLFVGSASRAHKIWETLGVKRTIMDSLAPILYDRLSTIAPALISPNDDSGWELMELLHAHYSVSLKLRMPRRLIDAFEAESYSSIIDIPQYIEDLRRSCTRSMSLVEEARTERMLGIHLAEVLVDSRYTEVTDDTQLKEVIDYGSFPRWESTSCPPVYTRLRIGSAINDRRAHLSLLAEGLHEVLTYKPPPIYKASAAAATPEQIFVLETLTRMSNSFTKFLNGPSSDVTSQESVYFEAISLLTTLVPFTTSIRRSAPVPKIFGQIIDALKVALDTLATDITIESDAAGQVTALSSMHSFAILRDTAAAVKSATQWIISFNDREKERDRSGKSSLPEEVVAQIKELSSTAESVLKQGKEGIAKLKGHVIGRDFEPQTRTWIFEEGDEILNVVGQSGLKTLVGSWEANIKGWTQVKWT